MSVKNVLFCLLVDDFDVVTLYVLPSMHIKLFMQVKLLVFSHSYCNMGCLGLNFN